jgi:hypothetical protein
MMPQYIPGGIGRPIQPLFNEIWGNGSADTGRYKSIGINN